MNADSAAELLRKMGYFVRELPAKNGRSWVVTSYFKRGPVQYACGDNELVRRTRVEIKRGGPRGGKD